MTNQPIEEKKIKPISKCKDFHYTSENMVKDLLNWLSPYGSILDAGSGKNKVWFKNLPNKEKYECEIEDGCDFYKWDKKVDWVVGNPPYHESWKFTEQALKVARKGVAWLINNQALNSHLTPRRLQRMRELGFTYSKIKVVADKRWFGRYYFIVLEKGDNNFFDWETKTYNL